MPGMSLRIAVRARMPNSSARTRLASEQARVISSPSICSYSRLAQVAHSSTWPARTASASARTRPGSRNSRYAWKKIDASRVQRKPRSTACSAWSRPSAQPARTASSRSV